MKFWKNKNIVLGIICLVFLLIIRLPSFFGPPFSSDEGFYLTIGESLNNGDLLYRDIWDNKPPLLYMIFAISNFVFGPTIYPLRILTFLLSVITILLTVQVGRSILKFSPQQSRILLVVATLLNAYFFEVMLLNAENIFVPLILGGLICFHKGIVQYHTKGFDSRWLAIGGALFALATWTKLITIPEIGILLVILVGTLILGIDTKKHSVSSLLTNGVRAGVAFLTPGIVLWLATAVFFLANGSWGEFFQGVIGFSGNYISYDNQAVLFGLPLPFLTTNIINLILVIAIFSISSYYLYRSKIIKDQDLHSYLLLNWTAVCIFCIFVSSRGYPHYFQQILPALSLVIVFLIVNFQTAKTWLQKTLLIVVPLIILSNLLNSFTGGSGLYNWFTFRTYYGGFVSWISGQQTYDEWIKSFDSTNYNKRDALGSFVVNTKSSDSIYLLGSSPEIYAQTQTMPGYNFIVDYHFNEDSDSEAVVLELKKNNARDVYIDSSSQQSEEFKISLSSNGYSMLNTLTVENTVYYHYSLITG